ncbi:hypothetical protein KHP60_04675 [Microvirga sp. 3-52]|uniref:hypothetical protein n=1 Tax=Microvirga sp. 3-52 TaxID=2792425 RepID=UPI001AD09A5E|nr:hypothetical protein [Microvirga sp. 3-52]MBO1904029.1 hypothetical protein [Microvirga sp. 3-52]MBS7451640.1 hypothetical protein [Microvirga sp. 3-52]
MAHTAKYFLPITIEVATEHPRNEDLFGSIYEGFEGLPKVIADHIGFGAKVDVGAFADISELDEEVLRGWDLSPEITIDGRVTLKSFDKEQIGLTEEEMAEVWGDDWAKDLQK